MKEDLSVLCGRLDGNMATALTTSQQMWAVAEALGGVQCDGANATTEAKDAITAHFDKLIQVEHLLNPCGVVTGGVCRRCS